MPHRGPSWAPNLYGKVNPYDFGPKWGELEFQHVFSRCFRPCRHLGNNSLFFISDVWPFLARGWRRQHPQYGVLCRKVDSFQLMTGFRIIFLCIYYIYAAWLCKQTHCTKNPNNQTVIPQMSARSNISRKHWLKFKNTPSRTKIIRAHFSFEFWGPRGPPMGHLLRPIGPYCPGLGQ